MNSNYKELIDKHLVKGPKQADLTDEEYSRQVYLAAEELLEAGINSDHIDSIENELLENYQESMLFVLLVLKIVRSKLFVRDIDDPLRLSLVFAVYKEHNRIRKRSEHPHGENFLVRKVEQLRWLFSSNENIEWKLIVVDDGCPENSGKIAEQIAETEGLNQEVEVLFLEDAITQELAPARSLKSTSESQKGGSIVYGMWHAVQHFGEEGHIVAFTDADLSTHLGQLGLLMHPIIEDQKLSAIGSRREKDSVVIKKGARNNRGKLFIYLWKRLIANLGDIVDTQCGFKAFQAGIISGITDDLIEKKFAFDIELLLRSAQLNEGSIAKTGIAWIDSDAASTTTALSPYLPMLKSIVKMYRRYFETDDQRDSFAGFVENLSEDEFHLLLDNIPENLLKREPYEFTDYDQVSVQELESGIQK